MKGKRWIGASALGMAVALGWGAPAAAQQAGANSTTGSSQQAGQNAIDTQTAPTSSTQPDETDASSTQIKDIVVTAQRREESLSRVGLAVTAIGADSLAREGIDEPSDLPRLVPGFQANTAFGGAPVYSIRGVGFNTRNVSSTAPVGIYLDEAAVAYPYMSLGLVYDLERVEVLKGPQGTLYGRNATGGLINYVTAKPTDSWQAGFGFEAGNYQTVNANAFVSGPLADGARVRLAVNTLNRGQGHQRSVTRDERNGELYQKAARLTLDLGTGGMFDATLTGNYWKRDGDSIAPQAIFYVPPTAASTAPFANPLAQASVITNPTRNSQVDFLSIGRQPQAALGLLQPGPLTDSEFYSGTARIGLEFSPAIRLQPLTSYQHLRQRDATDVGGVQVETLFVDQHTKINSFSTELRLIGSNDAFNWSVGGYYADDDIDSNDFAYNTENSTISRLRAIARSLPQTTYSVAQINASYGNYNNRARTDVSVKAVFANADLKLNDIIKVTAGGRYTWDDTRFSGCTYDVNGLNVPVVNLVFPLLLRATLPPLSAGQCFTLRANNTGFVGLITGRQKQENFAWRGSIDITPSDTTLFYGSISRGYKSGGFPVLAGNNETQFSPILQEKLTAYEIGTKLGLFDRRVQFNLSGFYYDYINKQIYGRVVDPIFGTLFRIRNVPESRVYGVDGELTVRVTPTLTARVAGVYLDTKVERFSDFTELGVAADIAGKPFPFTPKFQGSGTLSYDGPINDALRFQADATVSHQSKTQADSAGIAQFRIGGYTLVNGSVGIAGAENRWSVGLYGRNLFNRYYWTGVSSGVETVFRIPGMPREYGLRGSFRF